MAAAINKCAEFISVPEPPSEGRGPRVFPTGPRQDPRHQDGRGDRQGLAGNFLAIADFSKPGKKVPRKRYVLSEKFSNDIDAVYDYKGDKLPQGGHLPPRRPSVRDESVWPLP
ncbi:hypothetical protein ACWD25_34195 [Streptomyces sp. NPDC002920]